MDDKELIEWLRTSGSDLDPCLDAADTIERLQRELDVAKHMTLKYSNQVRELHLELHSVASGLAKAKGDVFLAKRELETAGKHMAELREHLADERNEARRERDEARAERDKLQAFKGYVHQRLDDAGVPAHPNGEHSKAGFRIGDRLDIVLNALGFYARREHMTGEPWSEWEWAEADSSNWLSPPTDEGMALENGGIARAALGGEG